MMHITWFHGSSGGRYSLRQHIAAEEIGEVFAFTELRKLNWIGVSWGHKLVLLSLAVNNLEADFIVPV